MALLGGGVGGVGNPVGGSFTGAAQSLEIIKDHCYAYSGPIARSTSDQIMLSFTSGNFYAVTQITMFGSINPTSGAIAGGETCGYTVKMNGRVVMICKAETSASDSPHQYTMPFLIPPYSEVEVIVVSSANGDSGDTECTIVGRIYRD